MSDQIVRDLACIKMHLEIAEVAQRTRAVMPSLVNFKDALARLAKIEDAIAAWNHRAPGVVVVDAEDEAVEIGAEAAYVAWCKRHAIRNGLVEWSALSQDGKKYYREMTRAVLAAIQERGR
jgi:hypothetical protein